MTGTAPHHAMILAAGLGTRMRPLTDHLPKPLIKVAGVSLIDHLIAPLAEIGVTQIVVNVHYLADLMEQHLSQRMTPRILISDEREGLLDSGGGVKKALPLLGHDAFFILNADSFWIDGPTPNLARLAAAWDPNEMDLLLLVAPSTAATGYDGRGDFFMNPDGVLTRRGEKLVAPFVYAGVIITHAAAFQDTPEGPFSLNLLFDRAIARGRLRGLRLDGHWLHVGTPDAIALAEDRLQQSLR
jgi:N-acetyl-alpha-D-muramate 1-phosphate uridylyltransferase